MSEKKKVSNCCGKGIKKSKPWGVSDGKGGREYHYYAVCVKCNNPCTPVVKGE